MVQAAEKTHPVTQEFLYKVLMLAAAKNFRHQAAWLRTLVDLNRDATDDEPAVQKVRAVYRELAQATEELAVIIHGNADSLSPSRSRGRVMKRALRQLEDIQELEVQTRAACKAAEVEIRIHDCAGSC